MTETNSIGDLPSIHNFKQQSVSSKVSGAVPSFQDRHQIRHLNDAFNMRIPQYLGESRQNGGNIIINIGPVTQSNIKTVELMDPYGSSKMGQLDKTNKSNRNTTGNSMEFRRNTAKAMLYEQEQARNKQQMSFHDRNEVENAYELKPRKIIKKRRSNVFERLSRSNNKSENNNSQDKTKAALAG